MKCSRYFLALWIVLFVFFGFGVIHKLLLWDYINAGYRNVEWSLDRDGLCIISDMFSPSELEFMLRTAKQQTKPALQSVRAFVANHGPLNEALVNRCAMIEYEYNDYLFAILGSQISTCHRDYNGTMFQKSLNYPTFTVLIFLNEMNACLDVVPGSHVRSYINNYLMDNSKHVRCRVGDVLIFNSNLIHTGSIVNKSESNPRLQMKLCHKSDREKLPFLEDYYKVLNDKTSSKPITTFAKHISCQYPIPYVNNTMKSNWVEKIGKFLAYGSANSLQIKDPEP